MKDTDLRKLRAPDGVCKLLVAMRLMPDERKELISLAESEQRSIGSMARIVYLAGLKAMASETPNTCKEN